MKNILLVLLLIVSCQLSAQSLYENDSLIIWNKNRPITWEDFKSEYKPINRIDAATIAYNICFYPKKISVEELENIMVFPIMYKDDSWVIAKSDPLLGHERTHFNIAELYARKIRKEISEYINTNQEYDLKIIRDLFYDLYDKMIVIQDKYDNEIREDWDESRKNQNDWNRKIDSLLQVYRAYEVDIKMEDLELEE